MKKRKKSLVLWADDDWMGITLKELKIMIVEGVLSERPCYNIFHYKRNGCYEGKPRKVRITIQEL